MEIKWSDMPSFPWRAWFLATKITAPVLAITVLSGFLAVFIATPGSLFYIIALSVAVTGLVFVFLQQFFDIYYARKYLFARKSLR